MFRCVQREGSDGDDGGNNGHDGGVVALVTERMTAATYRALALGLALHYSSYEPPNNPAWQAPL